MPTRMANAVWNGSLLDGDGIVELESGTFKSEYSFPSRFQSGKGTNPEELIAAAHAACFSMALSAVLGAAGYDPVSVNTTASVFIVKEGQGFKISQIELNTEAVVGDIDQETFLTHANEAKVECPVSRALTGTEILLKAKLVK